MADKPLRAGLNKGAAALMRWHIHHRESNAAPHTFRSSGGQGFDFETIPWPNDHSILDSLILQINATYGLRPWYWVWWFNTFLTNDMLQIYGAENIRAGHTFVVIGNHLGAGQEGLMMNKPFALLGRLARIFSNPGLYNAGWAAAFWRLNKQAITFDPQTFLADLNQALSAGESVILFPIGEKEEGGFDLARWGKSPVAGYLVTYRGFASTPIMLPVGFRGFFPQGWTSDDFMIQTWRWYFTGGFLEVLWERWTGEPLGWRRPPYWLEIQIGQPFPATVAELGKPRDAAINLTQRIAVLNPGAAAGPSK